VAHIVITPPAVEPVTLDQARLQTRASTAEDTFLGLCISGARAHCESLTRKAIINRTVEQAFDSFPADAVALEVAPAVSVTSVVYTDTAGAAQTMDASGYVLDTRSYEPWLLPALGTAWPATEASINAVRVRYVAGMAATAADVPGDIRTWLLLTIGYLYAQREAFDMTGKVSAIPSRFVDSLLDPFRAYGF
jgi:uncharacterized phiE125 gp8 family phage protein